MFEPPQGQCVGAVRQGPLGAVMDFHEKAIDSRRHSRPGQGADELRLPTALVAFTTGQLQGVGYVQDDRESETLHDGKPPNVHHQVVITERASSLGHQDAVVPRALDLFDGMANIPGGEELPLFNIHYAPDRPASRSRSV